MIELGQAVGNYRVVALLGEGAMGAVYLAEHPVIERKAALKVIHPQHARNAEIVGRFVDEAAAINRVGHQHIVEVTDFGRTDAGDFYFIMEYLEGRSLADAIAQDGPFAPERALKIAGEIADALAASHGSGVIHRDLKPDNIYLVERDGDPDFVKVLDFGLAKLVHEHAPARHKTLRGAIMGTPFYMSPEQCDGRSALDARADVYSLGVVLFEMLTGQVPFAGDDFGEVLLQQMTAPPPAVRTLAPTVPEAIDRVLQQALAKRADDRFASMELFRAALAECSSQRRAELVAPAPRAEAAFDRVPRNAGPRIVVAAALGGLLLAGSGVAFTRGRALHEWAAKGTSAPRGPVTTEAALAAPPAALPKEAARFTNVRPNLVKVTEKDEVADDDPPPSPRRSAAVAPARHAPARRLPRRIIVPPDEDDILEPSFND
jgi:tRNA A-37 threonylcarbamoyl transferase component Bud32